MEESITLTFQRYTLLVWENGRGSYTYFDHQPNEEEIWDVIYKRVDRHIVDLWKEAEKRNDRDIGIRYELFIEYNLPGSVNKPYSDLIAEAFFPAIDVVEQIPSLRLRYILED